MREISKIQVAGVSVASFSMEQALEQISVWAGSREPRAVFFCNTHSICESRSNVAFRAALDSADLCLPDGWPVAAVMRFWGASGQRRVCGPDVMYEYMRIAERRGEPVFLLGSTDDVLRRLKARLIEDFPSLAIDGLSPPFGEWTPEDESNIVARIVQFNATTVWVALGCPKQEVVIRRISCHLPAVILGVGAAFSFHAGVINRAPAWMQSLGLEWLHRLLSDPQRLASRYVKTAPHFVCLALVDILRAIASRARWRAPH